MEAEWPTTTISELVDIKHGYAFEGRYFSDEPTRDVLVTPGNFAIGGGFQEAKPKYYRGPVPDEFVLQASDLIVTMTDLSKAGDTLGYPAVVPVGAQRRYLHNQRVGKVIIRRPLDVDSRYLFYRLRASDYRHEVLAGATGTTVKHTSPSRIGRFSFTLPTLPEQQAISRVLGELDDKIELNRRMNGTLEAMARALFKSWFVDLDPYSGLVPTEWDTVPFDTAIEVLSGGTPRTSVAEYWDGPIPWFSVKDAPEPGDLWVVRTERTITQLGVDNSAAQILPVGTTILSARGTVGKVALVGVPMAMNQSCFGLKARLEKADAHAYFTVRTLVAELQQRAHGSVFDTINRDTLSSLTVVLPPTHVIAAFEEAVGPMLDRIKLSLVDSRTLTALRDTLLPKLVSGELRLPGAARFAVGAGA